MNYFDNPDRIDPDHVLARAAREVNDMADREGLSHTLKWLGLDISPEQLAYLAEQRAIRAMAARSGYNMGNDPATDEVVAREIVTSEAWHDIRPLLVGAYMDGMAIGMRAQHLKALHLIYDLPDSDRRA